MCYTHVGFDRSKKYQRIQVQQRTAYQAMRYDIHNIFHLLGRDHERRLDDTSTFISVVLFQIRLYTYIWTSMQIGLSGLTVADSLLFAHFYTGTNTCKCFVRRGISWWTCMYKARVIFASVVKS